MKAENKSIDARFLAIENYKIYNSANSGMCSIAIDLNDACKLTKNRLLW